MRNLLHKKAKAPAPSMMVADEVIHNELFSASDIIQKESEAFLEQCNAALTVEQIHSFTQMKNFGFGNAKNIKAVTDETSKAESAKKQIAIIANYKERYPFYKFITATCVTQICEKYNLYLAEASKFIGDIPLKNQKEIMDFRVFEKDINRQSSLNDIYWPLQIEINRRMQLDHTFFPTDVHLMQARGMQLEQQHREEIMREQERSIQLQKQEAEARVARKVSCRDLKIVAPLNQIQMDSRDRIRDRAIVTEDPIVLQPVRDGYLIVTVWGKEALDAMVQSEALN